MSEVACFLLQPDGRTRRGLRRYSRDFHVCPKGYGYHNAIATLDEIVGPSPVDEWPKDDPRWPKVCEACGAPFEDADNWQLFTNALYISPTRPELGAITLQEAPPGAMYFADWMTGIGTYSPIAVREGRDKDPRGHLYVKLPDGHTWDTDAKSTNGEGWSRTGEPPNVTASPSILSPRYHGHLSGGVLRSTPDSAT